MFKVGDKVICIDTNTGWYFDDIELNKCYTISDICWNGGILLVELTRHMYYPKNFKLDIKQTRKQKLEIICSK